MRRLPIVLVGIAVVSVTLLAQTPANPSFEAASVKPTPASGPSRFQRVGDQFQATSATLRQLIAFACIVRDIEIVDGPEWMGSLRFDVVATAAPGTTGVQHRRMQQALLIESFGLKAHRDKRVLAAYSLVLENRRRASEQLKPAAVDCSGFDLDAAVTRGDDHAELVDPEHKCALRFQMSQGVTTMELRGRRIDQIARSISGFAGRPVLDATGLAGVFDCDITFGWMPPELAPTARTLGMPALTELPTLQMGVEHLGLKLKNVRAPVSVLVIDHVERPTEN